MSWLNKLTLVGTSLQWFLDSVLGCPNSIEHTSEKLTVGISVFPTTPAISHSKSCCICELKMALVHQLPNSMSRDAHRTRTYSGYGCHIYGTIPVPSGPWTARVRTVYGTGVARKTRSILQLYGHKYGISFWQQRWLYRHIQSSFLPPCSVLLDMLYCVHIPPMISPRPRPQNV